MKIIEEDTLSSTGSLKQSKVAADIDFQRYSLLMIKFLFIRELDFELFRRTVQ